MTPADDTRGEIADDLRRWITQNQSLGLDWYLDEGEVAGGATAEATPEKTTTPVSVSPKEAAFNTMCAKFVAETLALIDSRPAVAAAAVSAPSHTLGTLRSEVESCTACELSAGRTNTVFGTGNTDADIVFIGEAPGRDEDLQGEPFVGASGQLLTKILGAIGFARDDVYICNILKCRPPGNRDPRPDEVHQCERFLQQQLALLKPRVICCLGRVAAQTLLKTDLSLGKLRQSVQFYQGIPVMATFHPAALLRNPAWKRDTWEDVRKLQSLSEAIGRAARGSVEQ